MAVDIICHGKTSLVSYHSQPIVLKIRDGARNFPTRWLTLPIEGLKYGFQGTINAKNLRKMAFHLPTGD